MDILAGIVRRKKVQVDAGHLHKILQNGKKLLLDPAQFPISGIQNFRREYAKRIRTTICCIKKSIKKFSMQYVVFNPLPY